MPDKTMELEYICRFCHPPTTFKLFARLDEKSGMPIKGQTAICPRCSNFLPFDSFQ